MVFIDNGYTNRICYNSIERNLYFVSDETGDTLEGI